MDKDMVKFCDDVAKHMADIQRLYSHKEDTSTDRRLSDAISTKLHKATLKSIDDTIHEVETSLQHLVAQYVLKVRSKL